MAAELRKPSALHRRLWAFLTSRQVAVVLLLAALAILLLSLGLPQVPRDLPAAGLAAWWTAARERYGDTLDLYQRLGLTNLFGSPAFVAILAALLLNTLLCTVDRLGRLWREARRQPTLRLPDEAYADADWQAEGVTPAQARRALRRFGARLHELAGRPHYFYSERWRLAPLGTVLTHLALFLLALAALLHSQLAWSDQQRVEAQDPGMILEIETVYDPGAGPFVAGGILLTAGCSLSLLFPSRRLWARLEDEGDLRVCLGVEESAVPEEIGRLEHRLRQPLGGAP